jgi:protein-S-isoprenylcysteine O-methyltransferase Ste14
MLRLFKANNGMNIVGQGGKIILFTIPAAVIAILIHHFRPRVAALPSEWTIVRPVGNVLLFFGILLWMTGVIQLLIGFPKGKLITTGAYGVCRNPIYSSFIFFVLPAISVLTLTWVYLPVAIFLYVGVMIFIGKEENRLMQVFGKDYSDYQAKVGRIIPFVKPHLKSKRDGP